MFVLVCLRDGHLHPSGGAAMAMIFSLWRGPWQKEVVQLSRATPIQGIHNKMYDVPVVKEAAKPVTTADFLL